MVHYLKGIKELLEYYTTRAIEYRLNLHDTDKIISNTEFVHKWRQGIGSIIDPINTTIDDLDQTPTAWNEKLSIFQLVGATKSYIAKRSRTTSKPNVRITGITITILDTPVNNNNNINKNNTMNTP